MDAAINVIGGLLVPCSHDPKTGWFRDGCCNTDEADPGSHTVCCVLTWQFLEFLQLNGNDLVSPAPQYGFPGLKEGDQWCVCAGSWYQAYGSGKACKVVLESTHGKALRHVPLEALMEHAVGMEA